MNVDAVVQQIADADDRDEAVNQALKRATTRLSPSQRNTILAYNAALVTALRERHVWPPPGR